MSHQTQPGGDMARKHLPQTRSSKGPEPTKPVLDPSNDPFASHRQRSQYIQKFHFDSDVFDPRNRDHQIALEAILALNQGARLEDIVFRGNVFVGEPENSQLDLQWLALLLVEPDNGRYYVRIYPAQSEPRGSERDFVARILATKTGHEQNTSCINDAQRARWQRTAKLTADWQMPISIITLSLSAATEPFNTDFRLFVPEEPESIYNTFALLVWRQALSSQ